MMRKVLLSIPPALSTLLFCAHLLYTRAACGCGRAASAHSSFWP